MLFRSFDQILLPPKHVDPVLLLDEVLSVPYRLGSSWSSRTVMRASVELHPLGSATIGVLRDRVLTGLLVCTGFFLGAILSCKDG